MKRSPSLKSLAFLIAIPPVLAVVTVLYAGWRFKNKSTIAVPSPAYQSTVSPTVVSSPTVSPPFQPVVEVTPSPSVLPSASPSSSASPVPKILPTSARTFLDTFYASYSTKDRNQLGLLFTADTTDELKLLHSHLFLGADLQGHPGGPTLFSSNAAGQWASGYVITSSTAQGIDGWLISVQEKKMGATGQLVGTVSTAIVLVPSGKDNGWLVNSYSRSGVSGKYDGFLIE